MKKRITAALTAAAMGIGMCAAVSGHAEEPKKLRVMPLGDSITDGFTGQPIGGYRLTLWHLLEENGYADGIDMVGPQWGGDGIDPNHAGYSGYAIWLEHFKNYGEKNDMSENERNTLYAKTISDYSISIDKLETLLGYDLFAALPDKVGKETADKIEAEDPHKSSWNWNL